MSGGVALRGVRWRDVSAAMTAARQPPAPSPQPHLQRRGGSGAVLNGKADVLLADKKLSAKSCSGAFRISRRGGPGAVLSRKNDVLLADKDLSSKSWSGWCGAFRTGRRTHTCARTCAHMHKHDSNAARRSDDETNWNPIGARRFSGVGGRGRSPSECASLVMEVWGTRVAVYPGAEY